MPALISRQQLRKDMEPACHRRRDPRRDLLRRGHLPGAVNIPHTQVRELAPAMLPDLDSPIVTYCSNTACRNSEIAANQLLSLGYTNVRKYAEGKQDWTEAGLPLEAGIAT